MDEIKVGEYIRTKDGRIGKIEAIFKRDEYSDVFHTDINCDDYECKHYVYDFDIKSHSKNIIDLIEEDDYVNGKKIEAIIDGFLKSEGVAERVLCFETDFPIEKGLRCYHNCDIKSILTHEQYEQNCYKVGDIE